MTNRFRQTRIPLNVGSHIESIHSRHLPVQQDEAISMPGIFRRVQHFDGLASAFRLVRLHVPADEGFTQQSAIGGIVIHNKDGKIAEGFQVGRGPLCFGVAFASRRTR